VRICALAAAIVAAGCGGDSSGRGGDPVQQVPANGGVRDGKTGKITARLEGSFGLDAFEAAIKSGL
jgi:hypothetical protein